MEIGVATQAPSVATVIADVRSMLRPKLVDA
jgi:hypothetical protein